MMNSIHHSELSQNGAYETKILILKGEVENVTSLPLQQSKILLYCNFPKTLLEAKYFNIK